MRSVNCAPEPSKLKCRSEYWASTKKLLLRIPV